MTDLQIASTTGILVIPTIVWTLTFIKPIRLSRVTLCILTALSFALTLPGLFLPGHQSARFLLPLVPLLLLAIVTVSPRSALTSIQIRNLFSAAVVTIAAVGSRDPVLLAAFSTLSALPIFLALREGDSHDRSACHVFVWYATASALAFLTGIILIQFSEIGTHWSSTFIVFSVMIRQGIFPFHAWIPATFERAPIGLSLFYTVPQLGTLMLLSGDLHLPTSVQDALVVASLATALIGGAQAMLQSRILRALGYLVMNLSGVILVGVAGGEEAWRGTLMLWVFYGMAISGLALTLWVIESRKGTLSLDPFQGLYDRMSYFAVFFMLFGLGCSGFPGTPGYIGLELLLKDLVAHSPKIALTLLVAVALNGIAIVRAYFAIFCADSQCNDEP